jgi:hypothetical protein
VGSLIDPRGGCLRQVVAALWPLEVTIPLDEDCRQVTSMRARFFAFLLAGAILYGCGSTATNPDGAAPVDAALSDATNPGEAGVPSAQAITEQRSRGTYQCMIARDRTDHTPRTWSMVEPGLVNAAGKGFLARLESMTSMPILPPPPQLVVSTFDVAGNFGPSTVLPAGDPSRIFEVAAAPRGDGLVVVWREGAKLRLSALDASGQLAIAPRDLVDAADEGGTVRIAAGPDGGFAVMYTAQAMVGAREVRLLVLGADGSSRAAPRVLTAAPGSAYRQPAPALTATRTGYAMVWRDASAAEGGIDFATADGNGLEVVPRRRISDPGHAGLEVGGVAGFAPATTAVVSAAGGYVAAWTEVEAGNEPRGASAVVRLARLDSTGGRVGPAPVMRATTVDIDEVEPTLVPYGDSIAVLWAHGTHIYICGGCVPDHRIELVLVDPLTLAPVSNLISLTNGGGSRAGGLLARQVAVLGDSLLTTYLLTFHVHATAGSAAFRCTKL